MIEKKVEVDSNQGVPLGRNATAEPAADWEDIELTEFVRAYVYGMLPTLPSHLAEILWRVDLASQPLGDANNTNDATIAEERLRLHEARAALRRQLRSSAILSMGLRGRRRPTSSRWLELAQSATRVRTVHLLQRLFGLSSL